MVDKTKLDQMLSNLRGYVGVLEGLSATPAQAFLSDSDKVGNAKYHLVIAIECCIGSLGDFSAFAQTVAAREW